MNEEELNLLKNYCDKIEIENKESNKLGGASTESIVHRAKDVIKLQQELKDMGEDEEFTFEYEEDDFDDDFEYEYEEEDWDEEDNVE